MELIQKCQFPSFWQICFSEILQREETIVKGGDKREVPTWAPYTPKRHTRPYFGCAERAYVQNAQNCHSWGVLGMRLPCVVFIQVHRQANAQLLTHIFITQVLHIQRMLGVLTEAFRVHPRATLQRHPRERSIPGYM